MNSRDTTREARPGLGGLLGIGRGRRFGQVGLLAFMTVAAIVGFIGIVRPDPIRGIDFFPYWYYGHFLQEGRNPLEAVLAQAQPNLPAAHREASDVTSFPMGSNGRPVAPTNLPVMVLLLQPFSYLPWETALVIWSTFLILLMLTIPLLVMKAIRLNLGLLTGISFALFFYGWIAPRVAVKAGQTSLLVIVCMLLSLLVYYKGRPVWAGVFLGLALSKYSIALPLLLLLLFRRQWLALAVAGGVQLTGLLVLSLLTGTHPLQIVGYYTGMLDWILTAGARAGAAGVELTTLIPGSPTLGILVLVVLIFLGIGLALVFPRFDRTGRFDSRIGDLWILSVVSLCTLLAAYHRVHDTMLAILPVALIVAELNAPWRFHGLAEKFLGRWLLGACLIVAGGILLLPGVTLERFIPGWTPFTGLALTTMLLLLLGASLWLGYRIATGSAAVANLLNDRTRPVEEPVPVVGTAG